MAFFLSDQDYQPLMRAEKGLFVMPFGLIAFPTEEKPGNIHRLIRGPADHWSAKYPMFGGRTDPGAGGGHDDWPGHSREGKIHKHNPCPIRRNHVDSIHSEGWCVFLEELVVALDFPFVRGPRARELVYNRLLQRAERILVGVPLLCGEITPEEALRTFLEHNPPLGSHLGATPEAAFEEMYKHVIWRADDCFDATTGKFQLLKLLADRKMQLKDKFDLKEFNDQYMKFGQIPFSLLKWEILGDDSEAKMFWEPVRLSRVLKK